MNFANFLDVTLSDEDMMDLEAIMLYYIYGLTNPNYVIQ